MGRSFSEYLGKLLITWVAFLATPPNETMRSASICGATFMVARPGVSHAFCREDHLGGRSEIRADDNPFSPVASTVTGIQV